MSGCELPVAMDVFRARYRKSFEKPEPLTPDKPAEIIIDLHQVNHTFLKGHHLMIQIQSSWFPIIDRNPQKYVSSIYQAVDEDFIKATHTIYCSDLFATYIELPVDSANSLGRVNKIPQGMTAEKVIKKYLDMIGGEEQLRKIKDMLITASYKQTSESEFIMTSRYKWPGKFYYNLFSIKFNQSFSIYYRNSDSLHVEMEGKTLGAENKKAFAAGLNLFPELDYHSAGYVLTLDPDLQFLGDQIAYLVKMKSPEGIQIIYYYDYNTGLKIKQYANLPLSPLLVFDDYRKLDNGIRIPFTEEITTPRDKKMGFYGGYFKLEVKDVKINQSLSDDQFK